MFYGDLSAIPEADILQHLDDQMDNLVSVLMEPGDVVLVDNYQVMHGRDVFTGGGACTPSRGSSERDSGKPVACECDVHYHERTRDGPRCHQPRAKLQTQRRKRQVALFFQSLAFDPAAQRIVPTPPSLFLGRSRLAPPTPPSSRLDAAGPRSRRRADAAPCGVRKRALTRSANAWEEGSWAGGSGAEFALDLASGPAASASAVTLQAELAQNSPRRSAAQLARAQAGGYSSRGSSPARATGCSQSKWRAGAGALTTCSSR